MSVVVRVTYNISFVRNIVNCVDIRVVIVVKLCELKVKKGVDYPHSIKMLMVLANYVDIKKHEDYISIERYKVKLRELRALTIIIIIESIIHGDYF